MNREVTHLQVLAELEHLTLDKEFEKDITNKNPGNRNLRAFNDGWNNQVSGQEYGSALRDLTWNNLGYRMARRFGKQSEEEMSYVFRVIKEDFKRRK